VSARAVLIVDDEPLARKRLRDLLAGETGWRIAGECADADEAERALAADRIHLVLLDVRLPGRSGVELLRALGPRAPAAIFTTAYDEHALAAFELAALDYLTKPIERARFAAALERAARTLDAREPSAPRDVDARLARLEEALLRSDERLTVRSGGRIVRLVPREIEWAEAQGNYVLLASGADTHLVRATLAELEARLAPHGFLRVHRSHLVRADAVRELRPRQDGDWWVVLASGKVLASSEAYRATLRARLGE
jgi:two-component system LytT family response regulator